MSHHVAHRMVIAASGSGQDRATTVETGNGIVLAVADGAGGTGGGGRAAEQAVAAIRTAAAQESGQRDGLFWADVLTMLDRSLVEDCEAGESTAVVAEPAIRTLVNFLG